MRVWRNGSIACLVLLGVITLVVCGQTPKRPNPVKQPSLTALSQQQSELLLAQGLRLWQQQQYQQAHNLFNQLAVHPLSQPLKKLVVLYQSYTKDYVDNNQLHAFRQHLAVTKQCKQQILFVTPNIQSLAQAQHFKDTFAQDPRFNALPICILDKIWFEPEQLPCAANPQQGGRIGCELLKLATQIKTLPFTHLVIFAEQGKANVHNGIMYLDKQDSYDVFIHELAHFSGFIDEYPLSEGLAKRVCEGVEAPNMVFQQSHQPQADHAYWQSLGLGNEQAVHAARTCDNHVNQAFKASNKLTFMEYHDTAYIPKQYLLAWQKQLLNKPNQPSAHVNFAQAFEQVNNPTESQFWRAKYHDYLMGFSTASSHL